MNKILPLLQEYISNVKANITISSITILSSLLIAKILVFPLMKSKKKNLDYSKMKLNFFINLIKKTEKTNVNNLIFVPFLNKMLKMIKGDEDDENDLADDSVSKIKKTKKIINKLTKEFIKKEEKVHNKNYESRRDKIFYILLNNMHFIKNNNNKNKLMNDNSSNKYEEIENS